MTPEQITEIRATVNNGTTVDGRWCPIPDYTLRGYVMGCLDHIDTLTAERERVRRETVEECAAVVDELAWAATGSSNPDYVPPERDVFEGDCYKSVAKTLRALLVEEPAPETGVCVWTWRQGRLHAACDPLTAATLPETITNCQHCGKPVRVEETCPDRKY